MKTVLIALGVFTLALCISSINANKVEMEMPTNLLELPAELMLTIFEYLDVKSLFNICKLLPQDQDSIERVFRKMFTHHTLRMRFYGDKSTIETSYDFIRNITLNNDIQSESLNEASVGEISEFLKCFGHCINKFEFTYAAPNEESNFLELNLRPIRKYVTKNVDQVRFDFRRRTDKPLNRLDFTFPNAKSVQLTSSGIDVTTLHQIFPAVRSLDLEGIEMSPSLPHLSSLERLTVPDNWIFKDSDHLLFNETLKLNPQLKHLRIPRFHTWKVIEMLNEIRPDIESLEVKRIVNIDSTTVPIRFENLKVFKWTEPFENEDDRLPLEFGNLEEIEFDIEKPTDYWIDVLMQNKKLTKVTAHVAFHHENLQRIADGLLNLEEFTMSYSSEDPKSVRDIVDFLRRNQMRKATFLYLGKDACDEAAEQLKNEWETKEHHNHCYFITIKNVE